MDINAEKIKLLRLAKRWTQQHLADASGLSLRTIQRVERDGAASKETVLCLCSVFEIEIEVISNSPSSAEVTNSISYKLIALTFMVGAMSGAAMMLLLS